MLPDVLGLELSSSDSATTAMLPPHKAGHEQTWSGQIRSWWAQSWRDTLADLKAARWGRGLLWLAFSSFTLLLLLMWVFLAGFSSSLAAYGGHGLACQPDGSFSLSPDYRYWQVSGFFQITLSFGFLTFTPVKVIDIIWDVVVGRGGQAVLAFYSWKAFSNYFRSSMQTGPITYDSFFTVFIESEASLTSTFRITRDFATRRGLRSRVVMACTILTMAFILAWPTIAAAMTGYTSALGAYVRDEENNLIPLSNFSTVAYVIHDGTRVNLTKDHLVPFLAYNPYAYEPIIQPDGGAYDDLCNIKSSTSSIRPDSYCYLSAAVSHYAEAYGFLGLNKDGNINDIETQWIDQTLPKPALNISAFFVPRASYYYGNDWTDPRTHTTPFANSSHRTFMRAGGNTTYSLTYMQDNGRCQPLDGHYQWGFSFLQLVIGMLLLLLWIVVVYIMWLKGHMDLRQQGGNEVPARYRAVIELATALNNELQSIGEDPHRLTNRQLKVCIAKELRGGKVAVESPLLTTRYSFRKGIWRWINGERWWLALAIVSILILSAAGAARSSVIPSFLAPFPVSVVLALAIGRTNGSRVVISVVGLVVALVVTASLVPGMPRDTEW